MAHVTINDQTPRVRYTVGGTPDDTFTVPFEFFAFSDVGVYSGSTLLTYSTDYTVTGTGSATDGYESGEVTLDVAVSNTVVTVFRDVPYERTTDFPLTGAFNITALNTQLDKLTAQVQQVKDQADRSLRIPVIDSLSLTTELAAAATRAGNLLSFDSSGNVVATIATTDVSTVAGISADVEAVSDIAANVTTVAGVAANVTTVAGISANVTTVAGISGNVTTVAGISSAVSNVSTISGDVSAVSAIAANVTTVAGISTDITAAVSGNFRFSFDASTSMADPGTGDIRLNNATIASATAIAISASSADAGNPDISDWVTTWDDSTNIIKGTLTLRKVGSSSYATFDVTGSVTDNTTWLQLTVAYVAGSGTFSASDNLLTIFQRSGNKGADGAGSVVSVTAADSSITVGGTAADPTISRAALSGDVTASAGSNSTTIANNAVTYAKLQDVTATARLIGRKTAGSGDAEEVTASEALDFIGSTRGSLLYRGASGWAALTPGTSGHVLKSNGAGADPSFVAASAGAWEYVSAATASASSAIDFQSLASGYDYLIAWDGLYTSGANQLLIRAEVSASWQASSYLSSLFYSSSAGSDSSASGGGTAGVQAGYNMGATTAKPSSGEVLIVNPAQTTTPKLILVSAAQIDNGSASLRVFGSGAYTGSNAAVTGLRFIMSGGETFTAGNFCLYRRARS